jgi:DNA-binding response OmpR family regulator
MSVPTAAPFDSVRDATILIVDDEHANLRLLTRILERAGFKHVHTTSLPTSVVELYRSLSPDLIMLDVHMPELDGFGVLEQLRAQMTPADFLPILAVTGDASSDVRQRIIVAGAKDFLAKPFDANEVLVRVHNLLTTRVLHTSLRRFLGVMSHELRTPLNSVIGFARQLEKNRSGHLDGAELEYVRRIAENGATLLRVVDEILETSRVESERLVDRAALTRQAADG